MTMKINCDKCGYILGGIEVKENYGCNACNPFWKPACKDCGHINGYHLDDCKSQVVQDTPIPPPQAPSIPPLPIQYCGICGRILTQTILATYFNHDMGEQYNHWKFTCPQYRWWKIWDRYHSHWRCNEDGSTYSYES